MVKFTRCILQLLESYHCKVTMDVFRMVLEHARSLKSDTFPRSTVWYDNNEYEAPSRSPVDFLWTQQVMMVSNPFLPGAMGGTNMLAVGRLRSSCTLRKCLDDLVENGNESRQERLAVSIFGLDDFLARLECIIRAACLPAGEPLDAPTAKLVHMTASLFAPSSLSMRVEYLELYLWLYPEQINELDNRGMLPIHHVLAAADWDGAYCRQNFAQWLRVIQLLVKLSPLCAGVPARGGRLPLHSLLALQTSDDFDLSDQYGETLMALVHAYSAALGCRDPVTGLFPFQMAASNEFASTGTLWQILRSSPQVLF